MVLSKLYDFDQTTILVLCKMVDSLTDQKEVINVIYRLMCICPFSSAPMLRSQKHPEVDFGL